MKLGIYLPKRAFISNTRLCLLHTFCFFCVSAGIIVKFAYRQEWKKLVPLDAIRASLWVPNPTLKDLEQQFQQASTRAWCTNSQSYAFGLYGVASASRGCITSCSGKATSCVNPFELYTHENPSQVLLHTKVLEQNGTSASAQEYFVPQSKGLSVGLAYGFKAPGALRSSTTNIRTKLLKGDSVIKTYNPGDTIKLTVPELLDLAGHPELLETANPFSKYNLISLTTGMELGLQISCAEIDPYLGSSTCQVKVELNPLPLAFLDRAFVLGDGTHQRQTVFGLRVVAMVSGTYYKFDYQTLYNALIGAIVLAGLPTTVMYFIVNYCLGHMSSIYSGVVEEDFDLALQVAGMATRLMASSVLFLELQDEDGCIARKRLQERLLHVFKDLGDKLDEHEVEELGNFCFHAVVAGESEKDVFELIRESAHSTNAFELPTTMVSETLNSKITPTNFNMAYSSFEHVSFKDVVELFDVNRRRSTLEKWFTPPEVKKYVLRNKQIIYEKKQTQMAVTSLPDEEARAQQVSDTLDDRKRMIWNSTLQATDLFEKARQVEKILNEHSRNLGVLQEQLQSKGANIDHQDGESGLTNSFCKDIAYLKAKAYEFERRLNRLSLAAERVTSRNLCGSYEHNVTEIIPDHFAESF